MDEQLFDDLQEMVRDLKQPLEVLLARVAGSSALPLGGVGSALLRLGDRGLLRR
jgi:hypothetical protein